MAICVTVDVNGFLKQAVGVTLDNCTTFVMLEKADYSSINMANALLTIPSGADFGTLWAAGFVLPMTLGLIAWAIFSVVNISKGV